MTSKIFRNSFLVGVAVFFLSIALFMGVLYQYFGSQLLIQLESEAALAARGVEMGSMDYLDGLSSANRITGSTPAALSSLTTRPTPPRWRTTPTGGGASRSGERDRHRLPLLHDPLSADPVLCPAAG